ncbi:MAG: hypothetical protein ACLGGX_09770 [Bdellovibrionia bacterium]
MAFRNLLISLSLVVASLFSSKAFATYELILYCTAPVHQDIESLQIWSDREAYSDEADLYLQFVDDTVSATKITREDVVEGYILLSNTLNGTERVLLLEENGWFVGLFLDSNLELHPVNCVEP